jgi:lipooligosaccharide transport system ATP-binding protein
MIAIEARSLRKKYGNFVAVDGIDFKVERGECFGFLGPNGAGKTTTMKMIYRASPIGDGTLTILGMEVGSGTNDRKIKEKVGVVPQEDNLDQELSVRENLEVFARFYGLKKTEASTRVEELLHFLHLGEKEKNKVLTLSGGERRRTQIARGLLGTPEIIVLDEPTTGLDPQGRHVLWERLYALKRKQATLLLTTHYMDEAEQLCDRLVIIDQGKIVAQGTPSGLIAEHAPSHVVEIRMEGDGTVPPEARSLQEKVSRSEELADRLLLYTNHGEELITQAAQTLPDRRTLLRRSTLEDVFLRITGRALEGQKDEVAG